MNKKKNTLIVLLTICTLCFSSLAFVQAEAELQKKFTADLFLPSDIQIESAYIPDSGEDMTSGVCLTATKGKDSEIYLRNNVAGPFSLEFAPLLANDTITLQEVEFTFTEVKSGDTFTTFVQYGTTVEVGIKLDDERAGLYYSNKSLLGLTTFANGDNMYTQMSDERVTIKFNPSNMSVYANDILVWSFLNEEQDGRDIGVTFNPFDEYRISISMTDYIGVNTSMMLYSVNSCTLDKVILDDVGAPTVSASFQRNGLVGQTYELPKGYGYDVWEGLLEVKNEVVSPNNNRIGRNVNSFILPGTKGHCSSGPLGF